ncbi:hypothetical protein Taro_022961 [Colocasia esculenta]|uniref:non-specific serine/threonine protein kinase n=1 Tax=Colocasia esculenta TaxID=4460 RepID=A0A843VD24_COLES|nr:hypothetical protein [Colocasia esculenta]
MGNGGDHIFALSLLPASYHSKNKPCKPKSARVSPANRRRSSADGGGGEGDDDPGPGERSNSFVGTEEYVAPEVLRGDGHGFAVDWWALGVLAYEMAYGRTPFRGRTREETFANILTHRPEFAGGRRSDLTDLVEGLLAKDPARRLGSRGGAEEVKAHPFFRGVRWELLAEVARPPFLASCENDDEEHAGSLAAGAGGFSIADYFKKLQQQPPTAPGSPSPSPSMSLAEF